MLYVYGGTSTNPATGFEFISNAARHGSYGINGASFSYGLGILNGFSRDTSAKTNYLAGAASRAIPPAAGHAGARRRSRISS